jgi:hypothetical protein
MATSNTTTVSFPKEELLSAKQIAQKKQAEIRPERQPQIRREKRPIGAVATIVTVAVLMASVLCLGAYRNELSYAILDAESELTEAESQYVTLQNQLDVLAAEQGRDASSIGMQEAQQSQLHYIDLATENKVELVGEMSTWDKIVAFFGGLFQKD